MAQNSTDVTSPMTAPIPTRELVARLARMLSGVCAEMSWEPAASEANDIAIAARAPEPKECPICSSEAPSQCACPKDEGLAELAAKSRRSIYGAEGFHQMLADNAPPPVNPQMQQWQGLNDSPAPPPAAADETRRWWIYKWLSGSISVYDDRRDAGPSGIPVAPVAELEAMQRERDAAMAWRKDHLTVVAAHVQENATLRAQLTEVQRERDEARDLAQAEMSRADTLQAACNAMAPADMLADLQHENATLRAERDAALDRARVAEQRIETAKKSLCGLLDPSKTMFCTKDSLVNEVERIVSTLGRFVADQEGT